MKKSVIVIGKGDNCPKCGQVLEIRAHKELTPKMMRGACYYKKWEFCPKCFYVRSKEEDRVWKIKPQKIFEDDKKTEELKEFLKEFLA